MITLGSFSLGISFNSFTKTAERITENGNHYFRLPNNSEYTLVLKNNRDVRCRAEVSIDGESVGNWILDPLATLRLERPVAVDRKFTFVDDKSKAAASVGVVAGKSENGLLQVKFVPEMAPVMRSSRQLERGGTGSKKSKTKSVEYSDSRGASDHFFDECDDGGEEECDMEESSPFAKSAASSISESRSGATILGAQSSQKFRNVSDITNIDEANVATITVRLVVAPPREKYMSLSSMNSTVAAKGPLATSIPPPVGQQQYPYFG